jgi:hypothetical protein
VLISNSRLELCRGVQHEHGAVGRCEGLYAEWVEQEQEQADFCQAMSQPSTDRKRFDLMYRRLPVSRHQASDVWSRASGNLLCNPRILWNLSVYREKDRVQRSIINDNMTFFASLRNHYHVSCSPNPNPMVKIAQWSF